MPCNNGGGIIGGDLTRAQHDADQIARLSSKVHELAGFLCAALNHFTYTMPKETLEKEFKEMQSFHQCGDIYAWFQEHCNQDKERIRNIIDGLSKHELELLKKELDNENT